MEDLQTLSRDDQTHRETCGDIFHVENDVSKDGLAVSEEEYWEIYYNDPDFVYEWNNGCLEVKPMSDVKGSKSYRWFCTVLDCYLTAYPVGTAVSLEIGFRISLPHKTSARIPDLAVVLDNNPVSINNDDRSYSGIFDLCIESLSHSSLKEITRDTVDKKDEYKGAGVKEYYILDARALETAFYRRDRHGNYKHIRPVKGDIIRSGILPGFQFRISDLYTRPSLEELAEDEVYHDYIFPSYKEVKQRAEEAEHRAEQETELRKQETARAEQERLRAERLAEKLRAMGIDLNEIGEF
ncbi:MAG: Uma2 family endonuclease [Desulfobacteraceae bacterium]|nr:Uma2 family endonuclease [Desulfobacteraceae bacterium]